jgi:hypothetical protein
MLVNIEQKGLLNALQIINKARDPMIPFGLMTASENGLSMTLVVRDFPCIFGTVEILIPARVEEYGKVLVDTKILQKITRTKKGVLTLRTIENFLDVSGSRIEINPDTDRMNETLTTIEDVRKPKDPEGNQWEILRMLKGESSGKEIADSLLSIIPFVLSDHSRHSNMASVCWEWSSDGFRMVGTDGHRLSVAGVGSSWEREKKDPLSENNALQFLLPLSVARALQSAIDQAEAVRFSLDRIHEHRSRLTVQSSYFRTAMIQDWPLTYPEYRNALNIPKWQGANVVMRRDDFLAEIKEIVQAAKALDGSDVVLLNARPGRLQIEVMDQKIGHKVAIPCHYTGVPFCIAFNGRYLMEGAKTMDKILVLSCSSDSMPAMLTSRSGLMHFVMPCSPHNPASGPDDPEQDNPVFWPEDIDLAPVSAVDSVVQEWTKKEATTRSRTNKNKRVAKGDTARVKNLKEENKVLRTQNERLTEEISRFRHESALMRDELHRTSQKLEMLRAVKSAQEDQRVFTMNIMPDRKATVNIEGRDLTLQKGTVFEGDEVVGHYDQKKRSGQIWSKPISIMKGWILHMM